jgi:hypothetical protein
MRTDRVRVVPVRVRRPWCVLVNNLVIVLVAAVPAATGMISLFKGLEYIMLVASLLPPPPPPPPQDMVAGVEHYVVVHRVS